MTATGRFSFPADTVAFLADLRRHNDKAWFDANRACSRALADYEAEFGGITVDEIAAQRRTDREQASGSSAAASRVPCGAPVRRVSA